MTNKFARLDFQRKERLGIFEAIWGEHKTSDQISSILRSFHKKGEIALVTRVNELKAKEVLNKFGLAVFH